MSSSDVLVRELGGGMWFVLSTLLAFSFLTWIVKRREWDPLTLAAGALVLFCAGSAVRAYLTWMQYHAQRVGGDVLSWMQTWPWFGASILLNACGAAMAIGLLAPEGRRVLYAIGAVATAVIAPTAVYFIG